MSEDKTIVKITNDLNKRMESHVNSLCATDDEVSIAYLLTHIDALNERHKADMKAQMIKIESLKKVTLGYYTTPSQFGEHCYNEAIDTVLLILNAQPEQEEGND